MDIDIDLADRDHLLNLVDHIPASIIKNSKLTKHNTGVYFTEIPFNPVTATANIDYKTAESLGYFKVDLLNVYIYKYVKSENHLMQLMNDPDWTLLKNKQAVEQLIHINNYYDIISNLPEPIDSVYKLAMFLAAIRPSKKYLIGRPWKDVEKEIWVVDNSTEYSYKKSHAISYAHLVVVNMNLLGEISLSS